MNVQNIAVRIFIIAELESFWIDRPETVIMDEVIIDKVIIDEVIRRDVIILDSMLFIIELLTLLSPDHFSAISFPDHPQACSPVFQPCP